MKIRQRTPEQIWRKLKEKEQLTDEQCLAFQKYADLLLETNLEYNLTAITTLEGVVQSHFQDSIALRKVVDLGAVASLADIGTGAGFPALPLKIMFPHLKITLIEVTKKRVKFLERVIALFGLQDVQIIELDWRTFLRKTEFDIDLFVTRAAISDLELIRMFKPSCPYKQATLIYYASKDWEPNKKVVPFVDHETSYRAGEKLRRLIFMKKPAEKAE